MCAKNKKGLNFLEIHSLIEILEMERCHFRVLSPCCRIRYHEICSLVI